MATTAEATATGEASAVKVERPRVPAAIPWAIALAWAVSIATAVTHTARVIHHDALAHGSVPLAIGFPLFLLAWQLMIAAMMLPSAVPLIRLFASVSASQPRPRRVMAAFLGGYAALWTMFGAGALLFDLGLHRLVDRTPWLQGTRGSLVRECWPWPGLSSSPRSRTAASTRAATPRRSSSPATGGGSARPSSSAPTTGCSASDAAGH